jgi:hypothetical protein
MRPSWTLCSGSIHSKKKFNTIYIADPNKISKMMHEHQPKKKMLINLANAAGQG